MNDNAAQAGASVRANMLRAGRRGLLFSSALALLTGLASSQQATAQTASPAAQQQTLPTVVVEGRRQKAARRARPRRPAPAVAQAPQEPAPAPAPERGTDPVNGFVPRVSATGTKTDTPILETPQSVSVVSREQLDARSVSTIVEALQYTAGVAIQPGGKDPRFDNVFIRGFDANGYATFRDGLREGANPSYFAIFRNEPYGIQRVDVLKGPSSVLYGQNAPGGLIDVITKRPQREPFGEVVGVFGTANRLQGAVDFGGPIDKDGTLFYRLTGVLRDADAQIAHFSKFVKDDRVFIAPAVTWQPNANTTLTILADYQRDLTGNAFPLSLIALNGATPIGVRALPLFLGDPDFNKFEQEQFRIGYQFEHRFSNDLIFRSRARYGEVDLDYRYLTFAGVPVDSPLVTVFPRVSREIFETSKSFSADNHVIGKFDTGPAQHTVLAGVDYQYFNLDDRTFGGTAPSLSRLNPVYGVPIATPTTLVMSTNQEINQLGGYLQDQIKIQNWILTVGGRFDAADQETLDRRTAVNTSTDDTAFTKRIGLSYLFDFGLAPYVSYSDSFLPTVGTDFGGNPFKPTTGQQYEAGVKYQPARNILVTAALFDLTRQNVLTPDPANMQFNVQIGEVRSRGFEAEAIVELLPGLNAIASFTAQDVEVTKTTSAVALGKVPVLVPDTITAAYVDYTVQSGWLAGWGLGAGVRYNGSTFADQANTIENAAYTVFDAGIHYRVPKGINLALNVKNIGNTVTTACTTSGGCQFTSPRIVTGTVSYRW